VVIHFTFQNIFLAKRQPAQLVIKLLPDIFRPTLWLLSRKSNTNPSLSLSTYSVNVPRGTVHFPVGILVKYLFTRQYLSDYVGSETCIKIIKSSSSQIQLENSIPHTFELNYLAKVLLIAKIICIFEKINCKHECVLFETRKNYDENATKME